MKPRTLLILLILVAGLGAFIFFYERELPGSEERAEHAKRVFRGLEAEEVAALVVESGGGRVRLEKVAEPAEADEEADDAEDAEDTPEPLPLPEPEPEWRIAEPAALAGARADRFAVERLLDSLIALEKSRTLEDADRAETGLEEPRARVTVIDAEGEETTLEIGAEVPASTSTLAAFAGAPEVYVVGGGIVHDLDREPGDWRDRDVLAVSRGEVERLTLVPAGGERIVLARRGEQFWLDEPLVDRASSAAVDQLIADLTALRAREFVDAPGADLAEYGLEPPRGTIEIGGPGEALRLEVGGPAEGEAWYGRAGGQLFETDGQLPEALAKSPAEWQSRSLSARRLYQIDRVTVEQPGAEPLTLAREGPDWRRGGEAIPYTPVSDFLFAVTDARADRLARRDAARAAGDLGTPEITITLAAAAEDGEGAGEAAGGASETITVYPPTDSGEVPATVTGRDFALYLAPATAETLRDSLERLRDAEPLPPPEEPVDGEAGEDDAIDVEVEEGDGSG